MIDNEYIGLLIEYAQVRRRISELYAEKARVEKEIDHWYERTVEQAGATGLTAEQIVSSYIED